MWVMVFPISQGPVSLSPLLAQTMSKYTFTQELMSVSSASYTYPTCVPLGTGVTDSCELELLATEQQPNKQVS
jgi:hypothetical protein